LFAVLRLPQPIAPVQCRIMEQSRIANIQVENAGKARFIVVDGLRVARRGSGTWLPIEPGWEVMDSDEGIIIRHHGVWVHS
jgi:hypothetical protein